MSSSLVFEERGYVDIKGKEQMFTYFLVKNTKRSLWELVKTAKSKNKKAICRNRYKQQIKLLSFNSFQAKNKRSTVTKNCTKAASSLKISKMLMATELHTIALPFLHHSVESYHIIKNKATTASSTTGPREEAIRCNLLFDIVKKSTISVVPKCVP